MKILLLDIETSPNLAYVWGIWEQNINVNHMVSNSTTLCWAAKWHDEKKVQFDSVFHSNEKHMLKGIHTLLDEADVVIHYNGKKFDIPTLNKEFLLNGMAPPAPYRQIDMLQVARGRFRFQSNKLDHIAQRLGIGKKTAHEGFQLWIKCMEKDPSAWARMKKYNMNDVVLLEDVYEKMLPWIPNHPNVGLYDDKLCCPRCGSKKFTSRGTARAIGYSYRRYQCNDCGGWLKGEKIASEIKQKMKGI